MRGRPRIYADKKERQRAYYARHKERQQERSRARYVRLHPEAKSLQKPSVESNSAVDEEETDEDKLHRQRSAVLSRTTYDLGSQWEIMPDTELEVLLYTLTADLRSWRKAAETDKEEYEHITHHALELKANKEPLRALVEFLYERRLVFTAVADIAQRAEDLQRALDPDRAIQRSQDWAAWDVHVSGSLCEAFADLRRAAAAIERNVQEIAVLYGVSDALHTMYTSGRLRWQFT